MSKIPEGLILALGNSTKQAKLRTICYRLSELDKRVKPFDYSENKPGSWLDLLQFGVSGVRFSRINRLFEK